MITFLLAWMKSKYEVDYSNNIFGLTLIWDTTILICVIALMM